MRREAEEVGRLLLGQILASLSDPARTLLERASALRRPGPRGAFETLAGTHRIGAELEELLGWGLMVQAEYDDELCTETETRFGMHSLVREYAAEGLGRQEAWREALLALAGFYVTRAGDARSLVITVLNGLEARHYYFVAGEYGRAGELDSTLTEPLVRWGLLDTAREVRPRFLYEPQREIALYREVLDPEVLGTARFYGAVESPKTGRYWLFLERVDGPLLWQLGRIERWCEAARWLARLRGVKSDSYFAHGLAEEDFRNRRARNIVYGHTHRPENVPLDASYADGYVLNQMYFNSGTWRRVYHPTEWGPNDREFIPTECLTFLAFYCADERGGRPFETWSGTLAVDASEMMVHRVDAGRTSHPSEQSIPSSRVPVRAPHFERASAVPRTSAGGQS